MITGFAGATQPAAGPLARVTSGALAALLLATLATSALAAQVPPPRGPALALVDTRQLVDDAPGAQLAERVLTAELAALTRMAEALRDSTDARIEALARQARARPAARESLARRADSVDTAARARLAALEAHANARRQAVTGPFLAAMRAAIDAEREAAGIGIVIDLAAGAPVVAMDQTLDITERVAARLRTMTVEWPRTSDIPVARPRPGTRAVPPRPAPARLLRG